MKKLRIDAVVPVRNDKADDFILYWSAKVGACDWIGDTPDEAARLAQKHCDEQNAKAEEPKPPEGFAFSDKPGVVDSKGDALCWDLRRMEFTGARNGEKHSNWRWLVPAAPKRETREEAVARMKKHYGNDDSFYLTEKGWTINNAFMRGAGFSE